MKNVLMVFAAILSLTACHQEAALPTPDPQPITTTTVDSSGVTITTTSIVVPDNIKAAILAKYPDYTIYESVREDSYWLVFNRVTIRQGSGKTRIVLMYSLTWAYIGIRN
jgi:ABC-type glycerol-3-phosphate transport system substrate-binding protein